MKKEYVFYSILLGLLLILGVFFIFKATSISEYLPIQQEPEHYGINFEGTQVNSTLYLNYFYLKQDFTDNLGAISFVASNPMNISNIFFNFPENTTNPNFECSLSNSTNYYSQDYGNLKPMDCNYTTSDGRNYILTLNKSNFYENRIFIKYKLKLAPNGFYEIYTNQVLYSGRDGSIILNLGKNYECVGNCIWPWQNVEIAPVDNIGNVRVLNFKDSFNNKNFVFKITAKSSKIIHMKTFLLSIGISIFVGSILAFLRLIFDYLTKK